jgi:Protein of unknown function (DUF3363)
MRLRGIGAFADAPPAGGIVEVRRFGRPDDSWPTLVLANWSDIDLDRQVMAPGATWLDYRLVERERMPLAMSGVGQEVRNAMEATEHLAADGLVRRQGPGIVPQHDLSCGAENSMPPACPTRPTIPTPSDTRRPARADVKRSRGRPSDRGQGLHLRPWPARPVYPTQLSTYRGVQLVSLGPGTDVDTAA